MSAPDGFDPKVSMLPDPGAAAAPIHTMRGGGGNRNSTGSLNSENRAHFDDDVNPEETQKILAEHGLGPGGILEDIISDEVKGLFVQQIKSGLCTAGTGSAVILHKDCSAVLQVLRELYKLKIQSGNQTAPSQGPSVYSTAREAPSDEQVLGATIRSGLNEMHAGLENCGNTCYLNSSLQLLSYIPEVIDTLRQIPGNIDATHIEKRNQLLNIFQSLYTSKVPINLRTSGELDIFRDIFQNLYQQQDVEEFMTKLFDIFYIDISPFLYFKHEHIQCTNGQVEGTPEKEDRLTPSFVLRPNPPTAATSVQDLVNTLVDDEEELDDVNDCITPNSDIARGPARKTTTYRVDNLHNKYLFIALNRFDIEGNKLPYGVSVNDRIEYQGIPYTLYSSILHSGTTKQSGHYIFLKIKDDLESGIVYDDKDVLPVDRIYTWRRPYGSSEFTLNGSAYVVIYKRVDGPREEVGADIREEMATMNVPSAANIARNQVSFQTTIIRVLQEADRNPSALSDDNLRRAVGYANYMLSTLPSGRQNATARTAIKNYTRILTKLQTELDGRSAAVPPSVPTQPPAAPAFATTQVYRNLQTAFKRGSAARAAHASSAPPATIPSGTSEPAALGPAPTAPIIIPEDEIVNSGSPFISQRNTNNGRNQYANRRGTYAPPAAPPAAPVPAPTVPITIPEDEIVNNGTPFISQRNTNNGRNQYANRRGTYAPPAAPPVAPPAAPPSALPAAPPAAPQTYSYSPSGASMMDSTFAYGRAALPAAPEPVPTVPITIPEGSLLNSGTPFISQRNTNNGRNQYANRRGTYAPPTFTPAPAVSVSNTQFYPDEYYTINPQNFQEGHLRMNFGSTKNNRRVYANATIGRTRTRIYGQNVANLQKKYSSRKRQQNTQLASQKAINLAAGKKPSIGNRMKGFFKRGGSKTRRANRRGTSRRRK